MPGAQLARAEAQATDCTRREVVEKDIRLFQQAGEDRSSPGRVAIKESLPATLSARMASGKVGLRSLRYKPSFQEGKGSACAHAMRATANTSSTSKTAELRALTRLIVLPP